MHGGLTFGKVFHEDGIVFGPALNEAYDLESKKANFPRILASSKLVNLFDSEKNGGTYNCFTQAGDGKYYLDYLPTAITHLRDGRNIYSKIIQDKIIQLNSLPHSEEKNEILKKWTWFENNFTRSLSR